MNENAKIAVLGVATAALLGATAFGVKKFNNKIERAIRKMEKEASKNSSNVIFVEAVVLD